MSESLIVIFLSPTQPPLVFEATRALLIDHAIDLASHTRTFPGSSAVLDFETAWTLLTRDKKAAHHFPDIESARHHVQHDTRFTLHERTTILSMIDRLACRVSPADRGPS